MEKKAYIDKHPYLAESQSIPNCGKTDSGKHRVGLLKSRGGCEYKVAFWFPLNLLLYLQNRETYLYKDSKREWRSLVMGGRNTAS